VRVSVSSVVRSGGGANGGEVFIGELLYMTERSLDSVVELFACAFLNSGGGSREI
jgi:hypothetical protein